jgi:peptidoglycan/xylan/chitin deacetylase (PgdA/CDA1 family)
MRVDSGMRSVRNAVAMAVDLALGAYPRFVYGGALRGVPVFTGHGVEADLLEAQLRFLTQNGYRTLTADELHDTVTGARRPSGREVVLTYDDGMGSLWSVGMPLFARYGVQVVVFLIPARVRSDGLGPTLDDVAAGRAAPEAVRDRDRGDRAFLSWEEIRAMDATGLVDFQSHTLTHSRVFCSAEIEDFVSPELARRLTRFQVPEWSEDPARDLRPGRPLYRSASRMRDVRRYLEDPALRATCEQYVAGHGGEAFFARPAWRSELRDCFERARRQGDRGRYETPEERDAELHRELRGSKEAIEAQLPGKRVRHLAYPWGEESALAERAAEEAGYTTTFPAKVAGRYVGVRAGPTLRIGRFGMDFLFRLPGQEREPLRSVLRRKLGKNLLARHPAR